LAVPVGVEVDESALQSRFARAADAVLVEVVKDGALDAAGHDTVFEAFEDWPTGSVPAGSAGVRAGEAVTGLTCCDST